MAVATDMDTMAGLADAQVDRWLGGHGDAELTTLFTSAFKYFAKQDINILPLICGLIGELINKVYDLENP